MKQTGYINTTDIVPTTRQIKWQDTAYYGIIYYGMNTFTLSQWGDGFAPAEYFWPEAYDVNYWVDTAVKAGMNGLLITAKHYDGFCIWQTEYTDYSLKSCPNWMDGKGDIIRDLSVACKKAGLKFGVYIAPWDRHEKTYGTGKAYDDWFCGLLTELCTNYGELFEVFIDPLYGEGVNGKLQDFDLPRYYKVIRELQPNAAITGLGPDGRWDGNDRALAKQNEWSVIPAYMGCDENGDKHSCNSRKKLNPTDPDIGSRKTIKKEDDFIWYPLEVSVPIRAHWFWDKNDEYTSKTKDKLQKIYLNSVGNNANLMLGLAPDKRGRFSESEESILSAFGHDLEINFSYNLVTEKGKVTASSELSPMYSANNLMKDNPDLFWRPSPEDKHPELIVELDEKDMFDKVLLREHIRTGQHCEEFEIFYLDEKNKWKLVSEGSTIGHCKICHTRPTDTTKIKIVFKEYREFIEISEILIN